MPPKNPTLRRRISLSSLFSLGCSVSTLSAFTTLATPVSAEPSTPAPNITSTEVAAQPERLEVDSILYTARNFDWTDATRKRAVPVKLYLPAKSAEGSKLPLVLFSHGIGGSREGYRYIGRYLASMGYASLHVQHVGSDWQVWGGNPFGLVSRLSAAAQTEEALSRVQDMKFALDQLLASEYSQQVDAKRIAVAGHSYGANTTLLMAGARVPLNGQTLHLRDPRVSAAIMLSAPPFYGLGDPRGMLDAIDIPTLHITATGDDITIPGYYSGVDDRISIFQATALKTNSQKILAVFKDGSHSVFTDRMGTGGTTLNPKIKLATRKLALAFLDRVFGQERITLDGWKETYTPLLDRFENGAVTGK